MKRSTEKSANGFGLVANGSSGPWDVSVEEALEREGEWLAEIEGPHFYLVFQLRDLDVVAEALFFLEGQDDTAASNGRARRSEGEGTLTVGRFGEASVELVRDDEPQPRFFFVVALDAGPTVRLGLQGEDLRMFLEAWRQVVADLPQAEGASGR